MKKFIIILAAIVSAITLCSAAAHVTGNSANGTIRFESTSTPALNCTLPMSRAAAIYRLLPESVTALCANEYDAVRDKCLRSSSFTHEGVTVKRTGNDPSMTLTFSVPGYKVTVSDVSWADIEFLFNGTAANE